jgi:hypothetical protein
MSPFKRQPLRKYLLTGEKRKHSFSSSEQDLHKRQRIIHSLDHPSMKWISLSIEGEAAPHIFSITIDDSIGNVDQLKEAIKNKAQLPNPAYLIQLEHPSGTILDEELPINEIDGGNSKKDPILASLTKPMKSK